MLLSNADICVRELGQSIIKSNQFSKEVRHESLHSELSTRLKAVDKRKEAAKFEMVGSIVGSVLGFVGAVGVPFKFKMPKGLAPYMNKMGDSLKGVLPDVLKPNKLYTKTGMEKVAQFVDNWLGFIGKKTKSNKALEEAGSIAKSQATSQLLQACGAAPFSAVAARYNHEAETLDVLSQVDQAQRERASEANDASLKQFDSFLSMVQTAQQRTLETANQTLRG